MTTPDLNLLILLDLLLSEGSVAGAARRARLSPSAMSRALARLREVTGDPLLVRAGRGLVPTPRAVALRGMVGRLVADARAALGPADTLDLAQLDRSFTLRSSDGFIELVGPPLLARVMAVAPGVRLRFERKSSKDETPLRRGEVDLETGVIVDTTKPELRARALFHDHFIGVARPDHPIFDAPITPETLVAWDHVLVSRRGADRGVVDAALSVVGLTRRVRALVDGFAAAIALVRDTSLIACVPDRHTRRLRGDLRTFALPVVVPEITVSLLWHPRMEADPAHRWLRELVIAVCQEEG